MMTKKRSSEILADENRKLKVKFGKLSTECEIFRKHGGNLKSDGKCIFASEGCHGRPWKDRPMDSCVSLSDDDRDDRFLACTDYAYN